MSRRRRAAAFALLAGLAALLAGSIVDGYGASVVDSYGRLRPVLVTRTTLKRGEPIGPGELKGELEVRRVPERFVPPGALSAPGRAFGLEPVADLPAGSYVIASGLRAPLEPPRPPGLGPRRGPVEINVSGAGALASSGSTSAATRVDVVVTTEPRSTGPGRTYVAAQSVPLISLGPGPDGSGPISSATLGLTRGQALRLIGAQNFARQVTLLPLSRRRGPPRRPAGRARR